MRDKDFMSPELKKDNLDRYYIRTVILEKINLYLKEFNGSLLDIGCGKMPYREHILNNSSINKYIGLDIEQAINYDESVNADYTWDGIKMPFEDNSFESSFGTEVLEHCPYPKITLDEVNRVLKPGGIFFFTVPFLWPLHETPHDEFRYTPFALKRLLEDAGFVRINIKPTGGWHASLAQMLGLWICRAPIHERIRKILKIILFPIYQLLLKKDSVPNIFTEGQMITGLYGVAYKK